ncbi:DUF805 domain-containing protein [Macrococcus bovicus]|uniref:DUF805 domain-containing protein n=1 Tax=Macrococcus bovicus TaxID=69968 RepID=UPI0025A5AA68|nr:DUF805 domain-containing protein [Macrococcus bovicus]WJP97524.1 DUF805 domain-containing protein [Macrococcus bovicus]
MTMKEAVIAFWTKGFDFSGRARRSEVWLNILANLLIGLLLGIVALVIDVATNWQFNFVEHCQFFVNKIFPSILLIPAMAQASRRLQDINLNGRIAVVVTMVSVLIDFIVTRFQLTIEASPLLIALAIISALSGLFLRIINFIKGNRGTNKYGPDPKAEI